MHLYRYVGKYELPYYLSIEIKHIGNSKFVVVHSTFHMNKINKTHMQYSDEFTDAEILNDDRVFDYICKVYDLKLETKLVSRV